MFQLSHRSQQKKIQNSCEDYRICVETFEKAKKENKTIANSEADVRKLEAENSSSKKQIWRKRNLRKQVDMERFQPKLMKFWTNKGIKCRFWNDSCHKRFSIHHILCTSHLKTFSIRIFHNKWYPLVFKSLRCSNTMKICLKGFFHVMWLRDCEKNQNIMWKITDVSGYNMTVAPAFYGTQVEI